MVASVPWGLRKATSQLFSVLQADSNEYWNTLKLVVGCAPNKAAGNMLVSMGAANLLIGYVVPLPDCYVTAE